MLDRQDLPILQVTLLNTTGKSQQEAEKELRRVIEKLRATSLKDEFNVVGSVKPFQFKTPEELAMALEGVLTALRGESKSPEEQESDQTA